METNTATAIKRVYRVVSSNGMLISQHVKLSNALTSLGKCDHYAEISALGLTPESVCFIERWNGKTWQAVS